MKKNYIAYGSNLNLKQMAKRCPTAKVVGTGVLKDYQLVFWHVATIVPKQNSAVPVAVWEIDDNCEQALDIYEGYPRLYRKEIIDAEINGCTTSGLVYVMNYGFPQLPNPIYFQTICRGYDDTGLDKKVLSEALEYTNKQILKNE